MTFSLSPSGSRELRKSSGSPPGRTHQQGEQGRRPAGGAAAADSPSWSLLKDRLVVSSFRFLLKSMHSLLSFFLMLLISCCRGEPIKHQLNALSWPPPPRGARGLEGEGKGHLLGLWGQVEAVPPPQLEQSLQVTSGFGAQAAAVQLLLQSRRQREKSAGFHPLLAGTSATRTGDGSAHLQSHDPPVDVLPHAHLHVKLRKTLVGLCARRSHLLTGRDVLREVQHVPLNCRGAGPATGGRSQRGEVSQESCGARSLTPSTLASLQYSQIRPARLDGSVSESGASLSCDHDDHLT